MVSKTFGGAVLGVDAVTITIETTVTSGTKYFVVGLPDNAVKESQHRIESALKQEGYFIPRQKVIINLAPADIRKEGAAFDLTMALGLLHSSNQLKSDFIDKYLIMGELGLDGQLRPIKGVLPIAIEARKKGFKGFVVPEVNANEAAIVNNLDIIAVRTLKDAIDFFSGENEIKPTECRTREIFEDSLADFQTDFSDVQGQENIKRAMEIAAAGGHNVIMVGPPGAGKTMLAKRLSSILPPLSLQEALETTKIHSVAGKMSDNRGLIATRPFRSPHHTISEEGVGMMGLINHKSHLDSFQYALVPQLYSLGV